MKTLQFSRYLLTLLCICPAEDSSSKWILFRNRLFGILTGLHLLLAAIAAATASYKYLVVDFESAMYAFPECVAVSISNYTFIMGFIFRMEIRQMFDLLQAIYDTCESHLNICNVQFSAVNVSIFRNFILIQTKTRIQSILWPRQIIVALRQLNFLWNISREFARSVWCLLAFWTWSTVVSVMVTSIRMSYFVQLWYCRSFVILLLNFRYYFQT